MHTFLLVLLVSEGLPSDTTVSLMGVKTVTVKTKGKLLDKNGTHKQGQLDTND